MAHSLVHLLIHAIFATKHRRCVIPEVVQSRLWAYLGGILKELDCVPVIINGMADHVHLLIRIRADATLSDIMRVVKTNSSRWIHQTWPEHRSFAWQTGYAAFSVSQSNADQVRTYIANQAEHHRTVTFDEEFRAFLTRHRLVTEHGMDWE